MITTWSAGLLLILSTMFTLPAAAFAEYIINLQGAAVFTDKNEVRIPGNSGTRFSLSDDLKADTEFTGRLEAGYLQNARDYFGIVIAPLNVASHGRAEKDISFTGKTFPAGTDLDATFRFDSYRLTWRRKFISRPDLDVWAGFTAKIRDASISLQGGGQKAEKANTGFVPLINFLVDWRFAQPWSIRIAGDALGASQGRAEDILFAGLYDVSEATKLFAGYRALEGGAENDAIYTFSLFHYVVVGMELRF